ARKSSGTWRKKASRPIPRPRRSPRSEWTSTPGAGPERRSTCARESGSAGGFKRAPNLLFTDHGEDDFGQNAVVIRVQPDEGATIRFGSKVPGTQMEV